MKKIITIISLFTSFFTFGKCVNLYVKKHYSGDPICLLSPGSSLEICVAPGTACNNGGTITGGRCTFYIQNIRMSGDVITYEFGIDECTPYFYAPKYGELMVNTSTKMFGFMINGIIGTYSYYNESEMSTKNAQEKTERDIQSNALEKEKIESDQKLTTAINLAISKKEYFKANQLYNNLNKANSALFNEINTNLTPLKSKMDLLYSKYLSDFNLTKKEYSKNNKDFILKNKENISISSISLDGKEAYLESIKKTTNQSEKKNREEILETESYVYQNLKGQHYIAAVGAASNLYTGRYDSKNIDKLQLALKYDTLTKSYYSFLDFLHKDTIKVSGVIVNKNNYKVKKYSIPYPKQLKDLLNVAINQGSNKFVEENYPILTIPLDYIESIPFNSLKKSTNPGEGIKNDQYEELKKKFEGINLSITKFTTDKKMIYTENFYNPILIHLVKKMYPDADSIVFALEDKINTLGRLGESALRIRSGAGYQGDFHYDGQEDLGSIIPLQKGVIELKNNQLTVYQNDGNYSEFPIRVIDNSVLSLNEINIEKLELDSCFYGNEIQLTALTKITEQNPIWFAKVQLGKVEKTNAYSNITWSIGKDKAKYFYNDSVFIQLLPITFEDSKENEIPRFFINREQNNLDATNPWTTYDDYRDDERKLLNRDFLRNYIINMTKYFEYKKEGNLKNANKSLLKANEYLEKFKTLYFNMKYFY